MTWDRGKCCEVLANEYFYRSSRSDLRELFERTAVNLCEEVYSKVGASYWFTDHGISHSDRVLYYSLHIAKFANECVGRLSDIEAMALACSCYLHDLGMAHIPSDFDLSGGWKSIDIEHIRRWHVESITGVLARYRTQLKPLYDWHPVIEETIPLICRAHGTSSHRAMCGQFAAKSKQYGEFRGDLLGKILLLADELDLGEHRSMVGRHPQFEQFPNTAKAHQFKHHYVTDVDIQLPRIRIFFAFHEDLPPDAKGSFMRWTCGKLQQQTQLVSEGLVAQYRRVFDFTVRPEEYRGGVGRTLCSKEVCDTVRNLASSYRTAQAKPGILTRVRPSHFFEGRIMEKRQGSLYPVLDTLMDDFFRECSKAGAIPFFNDVYVKVPENLTVGDELIERLAKYVKAVRPWRKDRLPSFEPFVVAGPTGAGKSALLLHLELTRRLCTRFSPLGSSLIVVHLDCLNYVSFAQILREMIQRLVEQCRKSNRVWTIVTEAGWERRLKRSTVASLEEGDARSLLDGVLRTLYNRPVGGAKQVVPVCFILDNLDRVPGFELKCNAVLFAARQAKEGYPFFVLTVRHGTKKEIDDCAGEIAAIPTHDIRAPRHADVFESRLDVAFSEKVLRHAESWARRVEVNGVLGRLHLTFHDLRESLRSAMATLISSAPKGEEGFVSALAGNNMRNVLTLFRAIIKSIDDKELLILCLGEARQHSLIRFAMLERYPIYLERHSKIRNMFTLQPTDSYFAKLYVLQVLRELQRGPEGDNYVPFEVWWRIAVSQGIPENVFLKEAWDLMSGNLALVEVECTDGLLPDDQIRNIEDLRINTGVRITSAGNYYLSWLIFDTSYLRCVLQDTLMDPDLARRLSAPQKSIRTAMEQVKEFVSFLSKREDEERIAWRLDDAVGRFGHSLAHRVSLQEEAALSAADPGQ